MINDFDDPAEDRIARSYFKFSLAPGRADQPELFAAARRIALDVWPMFKACMKEFERENEQRRSDASLRLIDTMFSLWESDKKS